MSVLISGGEILQKTGGITGLSSTTPLTIAGWFRPTSGTGYRSHFAIGTNTNDQQIFVQFSSGGQLELWNGGTFVGGIASSQSLNTWQFVALTITGTTATMYIADAGDTSFQSGGGTVTTRTPTRIAIGKNFEYGEQWVGQVEGVKVWAAALTSSELLTEMATGEAVRTSNHVSTWNLLTADATGYNDSHASNNNDLVEADAGTGVATDASNAPTSWGAGSQTVSPPMVTATPTVHSPTITPGAVTVAPSMVTATPTVHAPTITNGGSTQTVTVPVVSATPTVHSPTVTPGAVTVSPPTVSATPTVHAPTIAPGAVTVSVPMVSASPTVFAPTITPGAVTISVPMVVATPTVHAPTIAEPAPAGSVGGVVLRGLGPTRAMVRASRHTAAIRGSIHTAEISEG